MIAVKFFGSYQGVQSEVFVPLSNIVSGSTPFRFLIVTFLLLNAVLTLYITMCFLNDIPHVVRLNRYLNFTFLL